MLKIIALEAIALSGEVVPVNRHVLDLAQERLGDKPIGGIIQVLLID